MGVALDSNANIYVTDSDSVTVYPAGSDGNAYPSATITGDNTGIDSPGGIAVDSGGNIYVANVGSYANGSVTVFSPGSFGNVLPIATIAGPNTGIDSPVGIALDSSSRIYVLNQGGSGSVTVYPARSDGNIFPSVTITGSKTLLGSPTGIAIAPTGP